MTVVVPSPEDMLATSMTMHLNNLKAREANIRFAIGKYRESTAAFYEQEEATTDYLGSRFMSDFLPAFAQGCTTLQRLLKELDNAQSKLSAFGLWILITPDERRLMISRQHAINEATEIRKAAHDALMSVERMFNDNKIRFGNAAPKFITSRTKVLGKRIEDLTKELHGQTYQNYIISGEESEAFIAAPLFKE